MHRLITVLFASFLFGVAGADAQDLTAQTAALKVIRETAADICYTVGQKGGRSESELAGDVQAKVNGALSKFVDLGIKGTGALRKQDYDGVTQEALSSALQSSAECKLNVFNKLVERMLPSAEPSKPAKPDAGASATDITGHWLDSTGTVFEVTQNGGAFNFSAEGFSACGGYFRSWGQGSISSGRLVTQYSTTRPSQGQCAGSVDPSGRQMSLQCADSLCGQFSFWATRPVLEGPAR